MKSCKKNHFKGSLAGTKKFGAKKQNIWFGELSLENGYLQSPNVKNSGEV
jgi:hypothetical protein